MVVVIAPDKFKGSLTAVEAAHAIERGVRAAAPQVRCTLCPMADGGEGTVDVFLQHGARRAVAHVFGPLGAPADAVYAIADHTAILEMASASGLALLEKAQYDPTRGNTFGTGQLILAAIDGGAHELIIGLGGSATNDAGTGMLRALGVRFLDGAGNEISDTILAYERLESVDLQGLDKRVARTRISVAVDVDSPLCGPKGASRTFAAQKGASPSQVEQLDRVLQHIADVSARELHHDYRNVPGAGAAGGLGFALRAFLNGKLENGVQLIARACGLAKLLDKGSLCITGEGKIDKQTLEGKTVKGVAEIASKRGVPVIALGGAVEKEAADALSQYGVTVVKIAPPQTPLEESMRSAASFLEKATAAAVTSLSLDAPCRATR